MVAQREVVTLVDDLDGARIDRGGRTVSFAVQGVAYEIDLSDTNAQKFNEALAPYVAAARKTGGRQPKGGGPAKVDRAQLVAMRRWAKDNGYQVSERGRVSQEIQDAYHRTR